MFFMITLQEFFFLVKPVSSIANPVCIKNTSTVHMAIQIVSADIIIRSILSDNITAA
jgi:hypothetical protein